MRGGEMAEETEGGVKILAYACHHCAYAAADLAGSMRLIYPSNVRVIRIPCTGRLEALHVLRAFEEGVDGVFVAG
jgi:coenzyme F420-reducing hydrogenase delta subunit